MAIFETERQATATALPTRNTEFLSLKIEGIRDAAEVLVVALMPEREPHIFGRRTLPEMDMASVAGALRRNRSGLGFVF
jgi:5,6-dimethylbenzimidazole synthase